jgi:hypothetical protein
VPVSLDALEWEARELAERARARGAIAVADLFPGQAATVSGVLRSITMRPSAGTQTFEAELYDGTGQAGLIWLGRVRIPGIRAGAALSASGRWVSTEGRLVVYNPIYNLLP